MRSHLTDMTHNLTWTRSGTVWAMWRLDPLAYGYRPLDSKVEVRNLHTALFQALRGEALLMGVCASTDPTAVVERMVQGVDLEKRPEWAQECIETLDFLMEIDIGRRAYWLAVPLPNKGAKAWTEPLRSAKANLKDTLAMPRTGPSRREIEARLEQAELIRKALPGKFKARPASVAEMVWLELHAQQRGLHLDMAVPVDDQDPMTQMLTAGTAIPDVHLDPCGQTDDEIKREQPGKRRGKTTGKSHPTRLPAHKILSRRYLKVTNLMTEQPSYQVMLAMADVPNGGAAFPGGEWLGRIDETGMAVDWALRMHVRTGAEVTARNRRANANLSDQMDQRSEDNRAGGMSQLALAGQELAELQSIIDADDMEVEVEHTAIFAIGAPAPEEAIDTARELTKHFARSHFKFVTDAVAQEDLWHAMLPATPTSQPVRQLSQITTAGKLSFAMPIVTSELGDDRGSLLALEISGGRPHPVLIDLAGAGTDMDVAMAVGVVGELGSGKSVTLKKLGFDAVDRGATLIAVDRTKVGEWATAVEPIPGSVVVDVSEAAQHSLDPLRIFGTRGARYAQSFLTTLLNIDSTDNEGVLLSDVLEKGYLERYGITSLGALIAHLISDECTHTDAKDLGRKMNVFARKDFGAAIFDPDLPALDLTAPAIVVRTAELELPDSEELNNPLRFRQMRLEKKLGRAVYALITAIAKHRCFDDTDRLGVFIVDEAHSVTSSPEGLQHLTEFVRDGRKHLAALILGSHDPEADFGDEVLRGLIPFRIIMRHRDRTLAARGLRWLQGMETNSPVDEELIDLIANETSPVRADGGVLPERRGENLMRDFQGRIGRAKILPPVTPSRAKAVLTTPRGAAA
ncbi:ATP-binding protein [Promicromonospora sp. Marseille-Q5078]